MTQYKYPKTTADKTETMQDKFRTQATAPLDGMWLSFAAMAKHFLITADDIVIGYCVINSEQKLLQFYVHPNQNPLPAFDALIDTLDVKGALVSTAEHQYLSLCVDKQTSLTVNGLMYHVAKDMVIEHATFPAMSDFKLVNHDQMETAIDFAHTALGADKGWLRAYYGDRIAGKELFGLWLKGELIAAGECRPSKEQPAYADVGMVVSNNQRRKGLATNILRKLIHISEDKGLKPICSTESNNPAAQKAISRAGFTSHHRILDIAF